MTMTEPEQAADVRLNVPLVRHLMWGAGIEHDAALASVLGVSPSTLSRVFAGQSSVSARMLVLLRRRWPLVPADEFVSLAGE